MLNQKHLNVLFDPLLEMVAQHIWLLAGCEGLYVQACKANIFGFVEKPSCARTRAMAHTALKCDDNHN